MSDNDCVKDTLSAINRMQSDGVIGKYAIGGAVGATFYLEPAATLDIDVFVMFPITEGKSLLSLSPIYDYLQEKGGTVQQEHIVIGGWPVQFLPAANELECEAVAEAVPASVEDVSTWVMKPEHLVAIALKTGRAKDHIRILQFIEQNMVDRDKLESILKRHGLTPKWQAFEHKYLEGDHG